MDTAGINELIDEGMDDRDVLLLDYKLWLHLLLFMRADVSLDQRRTTTARPTAVLASTAQFMNFLLNGLFIVHYTIAPPL